MTGQGFSSKRTAEIAGITYRQLDYWAREEIVSPSLTQATGSGSRRLYSYRDLLELRVIKALLDSGIQLQQIRKALQYLREHLEEDVTTANLVINGPNSLVINTGDELVELLKSGQGVLNVLPLAGVKESLDERIVEFSPVAALPIDVTSSGDAEKAENAEIEFDNLDMTASN